MTAVLRPYQTDHTGVSASTGAHSEDEKPREDVVDRVEHEQTPKAERKRQNGPKATTAIILDPRDPMQAARALVAAHFVNDDHRLMHRHRGTFWSFATNHFVLADQE